MVINVYIYVYLHVNIDSSFSFILRPKFVTSVFKLQKLDWMNTYHYLVSECTLLKPYLPWNTCIVMELYTEIWNQISEYNCTLWQNICTYVYTMYKMYWYVHVHVCLSVCVYVYTCTFLNKMIKFNWMVLYWHIQYTCTYMYVDVCYRHFSTEFFSTI